MNNNYGVEPKSVDFGEAIGTCFKKYFLFEGRASKSEFWYFFLFYFFGYFIIEFIGQSLKNPALMMVSAIMAFGTIVPMVSVSCRRLHDINKSGWWQLIPIYNLILCAQDSVSGSTQVYSSSSTDIKSSNESFRSSSQKNDLTDELEELQELYKDGTLSEEQFKKAKKKLLK